MNRLLFLLTVLFGACASTEVRENGRVVFKTQMNCAYMEYQSPSRSRLIVHGMNHSTPTRAGGSVIGTIGTAVTGVAGAVITNGIVR